MVGDGVPSWVVENGELEKDGTDFVGIFVLQELLNSTSIMKRSRVFFPICI